MILRNHNLTIGVAIATLVSACGCTSHVRTQYEQVDDVAALAARSSVTIPAFEYPRAEVPVSNHVVGRGATSGYQLRLLEIPSIGDNGQDGDLITARYFQSTESGPRPLVIVLPIWAKFTYPSKKICSYLQNHSDGGVHVLDVQGEDFLVDWTRLAEAPDEATFIELWKVAAERERA